MQDTRTRRRKHAIKRGGRAWAARWAAGRLKVLSRRPAVWPISDPPTLLRRCVPLKEVLRSRVETGRDGTGRDETAILLLAAEGMCGWGVRLQM